MYQFLLVFFIIFFPKISNFCQAQSGIRLTNQSAIKGIKIRKNSQPEPEITPTLNNDDIVARDKDASDAPTKASPPPSPNNTGVAELKKEGDVVKLNDKAKEEKSNTKSSEKEEKNPGSEPQKTAQKNGTKSVAKTSAQKRAEQKIEFTTLESIESDYVKMRKETKTEALKRTVTGLANDSRKAKPTYTLEKIKKQRDSVRLLSQEINHLQEEEDSLEFLYEKDLLNYQPAFFCNFGPLRSRAFFDLIYGGNGTRFKALSNTGISLGTNTASLYSEILSGNIGLFRVSMGTMISNSRADSTQKQHLQQQNEAYQRLVTYGGNTVLNIEYPVLYLHSNNSQYNLIGRIITKGTADFPSLGTNTTKWAGSGSLGLDFYGDAALNNDKLRFFFNANANGVIGTDQFIKNLGITNDKFVFGQLSVGLVFMQNYKISFIIHTLSTEDALQNRAVIAGGQVLR